MRSRRFAPLLSIAASALLTGCAPHAPRSAPTAPAATVVPQFVAAPLPPELAICNLRFAISPTETLSPGVTHIRSRQPDGTDLDLFRFDFRSDSRLRLELVDQDLLDANPGDDQCDFWPRSVGWLAATRPDVVFATNGPFFSVEERAGRRIGRHIAPVVVGGKALYNVGSHRWTFGVKQTAGGPRFLTLHLPPPAEMQKRFSFGAAGLQCLVRDGRPLRLEPFPAVGAPPKRGPVPSSPAEAGHIPVVDHMKTSRISFGWTRDSRTLYALCVTEPDNETESALKLRHGETDRGGWTIADVQRFWLSMRVWGAVNSDAGDVEQFAYRTDRGTIVKPARWANPPSRITLQPGQPAPPGGSLMYWAIRRVDR